MGRVYLARSEGGRTVAVKVVHEEHASDQRFRARFRREVEAVRKVGEHFTAPVLDADPEADRPWVATGFVPGPSLEQVVRGHGPLPAESILALADGLLKALRGIHGAGILHRDLKPSNVMLTVEGPRVIDFGIARALEPSVDSLLTSTGLVVGSPGFMAPEQVRGESLGPAADVFALGCVLMYAATGRLPFGHGASNQHAIMFQIVEAEPDLDQVRDEALRGVIARCLTKSPDERPGVDALLEDPALSGATTADGSWLPPGLVARLARQAARLLDVEALATTDRAPEADGPEPVAAAGGKRGAGSEDGSGPAPAVSSGTGTLGLRDRAADADGRDGARDPGAAAGSAPEGAGERPERRRGRGTWLVAAAALAVVSVGGSVTYYIQDEARHRDIQGAPGGRGSTPPASPTTGATATPPPRRRPPGARRARRARRAAARPARAGRAGRRAPAEPSAAAPRARPGAAGRRPGAPPRSAARPPRAARPAAPPRPEERPPRAAPPAPGARAPAAPPPRPTTASRRRSSVPGPSAARTPSASRRPSPSTGSPPAGSPPSWSSTPRASTASTTRRCSRSPTAASTSTCPPAPWTRRAPPASAETATRRTSPSPCRPACVTTSAPPTATATTTSGADRGPAAGRVNLARPAAPPTVRAATPRGA
ncbi:protein kinase [Streptomyces sp. NPDC058745]|uniref:serine/threonine-protein kinase n=1 Tax=Streptomyces sp. NPDC058745 TaxID=3346621 RepID=UPI00367881D3